MNSFAEIIDALGGPAQYGRAVGITTERAAEHRSRNTVSPVHWPKLIDAAQRHGIGLSHADLTRIYAERRQARERAAS